VHLCSRRAPRLRQRLFVADESERQGAPSAAKPFGTKNPVIRWLARSWTEPEQSAVRVEAARHKSRAAFLQVGVPGLVRIDDSEGIQEPASQRIARGPDKQRLYQAIVGENDPCFDFALVGVVDQNAPGRIPADHVGF
jgi:hypothetical protein